MFNVVEALLALVRVAEEKDVDVFWLFGSENG